MSSHSFGGGGSRNAFANGLQGFGGAQGLNSQGGAGAGLAGMSSLNSGPSGGSQTGAAIESLTLTAQSVGLTIEQLAAALSSSPNLKALSQDGGNNDSQKELALSLYRTESLALYRRCMLLAGFEPDAIEETSPEYLQFAFKAWQEEGKRLQDLMGMEMNLQAPVVANLSLQQAQQQQQEVAQAQAHAHVQAQVQAQAVQAQAQALALEQQQQKQQLLLQNRLHHQQNSGLKSLLQYGGGGTPSASAAAGGHHQSTAHQQLYNDAMQKRLTGMQLLNNSLH